MIYGNGQEGVVSQVSLVVRSGANATPVRSAEKNPDPAFLTVEARVLEGERGYTLLAGLGHTCAQATKAPLPYDKKPRDTLLGVAPELTIAPRMFPVEPLRQKFNQFTAWVVGLATIGSAKPVRARQEAIDATAGLLADLGLPFSVPLTKVEPGRAGLIFRELPIDASVEAGTGTLHFRAPAADIAAAGTWATLAATTKLPEHTILTYDRLPGFEGQVSRLPV